MSKSGWPVAVLQQLVVVTLPVLGLLLFHQSDHPAVLNRYSLPVFAAMLLLAALVGSSLALVVYMRRHPQFVENVAYRIAQAQRFRWLILTLTSLFIIAVWLFLLGNHLAIYGLLRAYLCFEAIVIGLALSYGGTASTGSGGSSRLKPYLPMAALAALAIVAVLTLDIYPSLYRSDEAFVFSMGVNRLDNGLTQPTIYRFAYSAPNFSFAGLWTHGLGLWIGLAGFGMASGRAYFLLLFALSLPFLWLAAARLYGKPAAWVAVLLAATAYVSQNRIRYDVVSALFLSMALFFYSLTLNSTRRWPHFFAGLAAGLCMDGPPIAALFGIGFGLFYGLDCIREIRQHRRWWWAPFWLLAAGGALGVAIFLVLRAGSGFTTNSTNEAAVGYFAEIGQRIQAGFPLKQLDEFYRSMFTGQPILSLTMFVGLYVALRDRSIQNRLLICLYVVWITFMIVGYHYFPTLYLTHGLPILAMFAAQAFLVFIPRFIAAFELSDSALQAIAVLLIVWLGASTVLGVHTARLDSRQDLVETGRQIAQMLPANSVVVAPEPYYFGMPKTKNFVAGATDTLLVSTFQISLTRAWEIITPDSVVFSANWPEPARTPELMAYLSAHQFKQVACWQTDSYGRVELWSKLTEIAPMQTGGACQRVCIPINSPCR